MPNITLRTVVNTGDPITLPDGTPLGNTLVTFALVDAARRKPISLFDAVSGEYIVAQNISVTTDTNGEFIVGLWPNVRGEIATVYKVSIDNVMVKPFYVRVPEGVGNCTFVGTKAELEILASQDATLLSNAIAGAEGLVVSASATAGVVAGQLVTAAALVDDATVQALSAINSAGEAAASAVAASGFAGNTAASVASVLAAEIATGASALAASTSESNAALSADNAGGSALAASGSAALASTKATDSNNSAIASAASEVNAAGSALAAYNSELATEANASQTALDKLATNADVLSTNADATQTALDAISTNADKLATAQSVIDADASAAAASSSAGSAEASAVLVSQALNDVLGTTDIGVTVAAALTADQNYMTDAQITALHGVNDVNASSTPVAHATESAATVHGGLLQIGTTATTAMAGNTSIPSITGLLDETAHDALDHTGLTGVPTAYTLPTASTTVLGGVKVDGITVTITNGVISGSSSYLLPVATASVLGGVKQGVGTNIDANGVISVTASGTGDVIGPASATNSEVALFDTATGKAIKGGGILGTGAFAAANTLAIGTGATDAMAGNKTAVDLGGAAALTTDQNYVTDAQITALHGVNDTNISSTPIAHATESVTTVHGGIVPATRTVNGHPLTGNVTVTTTDLGLANVDNTSDALKPISTATQTALNGKIDDSQVLTNVPAGAVFTDTIYTHPTNHPPSVITQDTSNRFTTDAEKAAWTAKEPAITAGTTAQYFKGDKTLGTFATDVLAVAPAETATTIKAALGNATTSTAGLMSSSDKIALDNLAVAGDVSIKKSFLL